MTHRIMRIQVVPRALLVMLPILVLLSGCGGKPAAISRLEQGGKAGTAALWLMEAHGGLARFLALGDLQADVKVEQFNASGILESTTRELHRFEAAPPSRYLLRRGEKRITEFGLEAGQGWVRIDGVLQDRPTVSELATHEIMLLQILSRAPFCVADPGLKLTAMPD
ncbi:MAG: hypothetical protein ACE5ID_12460, partial [Acidobacteriota bacterium]